MVAAASNWEAPSIASGVLRNAGIPEIMAGAFEDQQRVLFVVVTVVLMEAVFWSSNLFYAIITHFNIFGLQRFKIKNGRPYPTAEIMRECLVDVIMSHFLVRPILLFLVYPIIRSLLSFDLELPTLTTVAWQYAVCMQVDDCWFYWTHRMLHHRWFYAAIHKKHHNFRHAVPLAVEWCHPLEDLLSNALGTMLGPLLLHAHVTLFWLYICLKLWQSIDAHSGYNLPFPWSPWNCLPGMDCAPAHDYHHSHNVGNYGGYFIFWDWLMGTDLKYQDYIRRNARASPADRTLKKD